MTLTSSFVEVVGKWSNCNGLKREEEVMKWGSDYKLLPEIWL